MNNSKKEYEFQKLNSVYYTDHYIDRKKRRNRLWMWFDRKTGYKLLPKVMLAMFVVTVGLLGLVLLFIRYNIGTVLPVDLGVAVIVIGLLLLGESIVLLRTFGELSRLYGSDTLRNPMLNPGLHHLKDNIFHHDSDE